MGRPSPTKSPCSSHSRRHSSSLSERRYRCPVTSQIQVNISNCTLSSTSGWGSSSSFCCCSSCWLCSGWWWWWWVVSGENDYDDVEVTGTTAVAGDATHHCHPWSSARSEDEDKNIKPTLVQIITIILLLLHSRLCVGMETWNCHSYRGQREGLAWLPNAPLQRVHTSNCGRPGTRCGRLYLPNCDDRSERDHTSRRDSRFVYPYLNATRTRPRRHAIVFCCVSAAIQPLSPP